MLSGGRGRRLTVAGHRMQLEHGPRPRPGDAGCATATAALPVVPWLAPTRRHSESNGRLAA
jgi:hypothetical protein